MQWSSFAFGTRGRTGKVASSTALMSPNRPSFIGLPVSASGRRRPPGYARFATDLKVNQALHFGAKAVTFAERAADSVA